MTSLTGLSPNNPRRYLGPNVGVVTIVTRTREPTGADYRQPETGKLYPFGSEWLVGENPTTGTYGDLWYLSKIVANVAYWVKVDNISFVTGTFTPGIAFGGLSVGVTYLVQEGRYTIVGNMLFFTIHVNLTSKGSSTGNVTITGLPVNVGGISSQISFVQLDEVTYDMAYDAPFLRPLTGSTKTAEIWQTGNAINSLNLSNTNFSDTSNVRCQGFYFI